VCGPQKRVEKEWCNNLLNILANPKSQSLTWPCLVIRMFSGFTSLWMHWKT